METLWDLSEHQRMNSVSKLSPEYTVFVCRKRQLHLAVRALQDYEPFLRIAASSRRLWRCLADIQRINDAGIEFLKHSSDQSSAKNVPMDRCVSLILLSDFLSYLTERGWREFRNTELLTTLRDSLEGDHCVTALMAILLLEQRRFVLDDLAAVMLSRKPKPLFKGLVHAIRVVLGSVQRRSGFACTNCEVARRRFELIGNSPMDLQSVVIPMILNFLKRRPSFSISPKESRQLLKALKTRSSIIPTGDFSFFDVVKKAMPNVIGCTFNKCSACRQAWYCGVECQRAHWKDGHRSFCKRRQKEKEEKEMNS
eukprot:8058_1